jgi:hypothetical protein
MATGRIAGGPHVRIYFHTRSAPGKEEGIIKFCVPSGNRYVVDPSGAEVHFDSLDDIPAKLRELFRLKGVKWP